MYFIFISLLALITIILLDLSRKKRLFGNESITSEKRKIHTTSVNRFGGIVFFYLILSINLIEDQMVINILLSALFISIIGYTEDIFLAISKYLRLIFMIISISFFVIYFDFYIYNFDNYFLDIFFSNSAVLSYSFVILGLLFSINGFNFIDGVNGLLLGMSILILSIFLYYSYGKSDSLSILCFSILICTSILFVFNFFMGKVLTGDGGAYFLGFIIGAISIEMCNRDILSATNISYIICYPIIEVCFSFLRRFFNKNGSSLEPDSLHLHQLVFFLLKKKLLNIYKNEVIFNSLSAAIILVIYSLLIFIAEFFKYKIDNIYILFAFILIYIFSYFYLYKVSQKYDK